MDDCSVDIVWYMTGWDDRFRIDTVLIVFIWVGDVMDHYRITVSGGTKTAAWFISIPMACLHFSDVQQKRSHFLPRLHNIPRGQEIECRVPERNHLIVICCFGNRFFFYTLSTKCQGKCTRFFSQNKASDQWPLWLGNNSLRGHVAAVQEQQLRPIECLR